MELTDFETGLDEMVDDGVITAEEADLLIEIENEAAKGEEAEEEAPGHEGGNKLLIHHRLFNGMGPKMMHELKKLNIVFIYELVDLGVDGIDALDIKGLGSESAAGWYAEACKIMERHRA